MGVLPVHRARTVRDQSFTNTKQSPSCLWADQAHQYSQYSTLHGLRYIGDTKLHFVERAFWVVSFLLAVIAAIYFITNTFRKYTETPVIMTMSPTATLLSSIPFPAITICNMNNVRRSEAEKILKAPNDTTSILERQLLRSRCNHDLDEVEDNRTSDWNYIKEFMFKVSQPCEDMLVACLWHREFYNCSEIFHPILTDEGVCCTFNKLNRTIVFQNPLALSDLNDSFKFPSADWSPQNGYPANTPHDYLPWRPWGTGSHLGLTLVLDAEQNEYYCSSEASFGFKILLHNPVESPKMSSFGSAISPGKETRFVINPHIMTSTSQLTTIPIEKRNCFFNNERPLRFFRVYTENNCVRECEANFTLSFCNCVMYYMPKDRFTHICGKKDSKCALHAQRTMEILKSQKVLNTTIPHNATLTGCDCLPGCFELDYSKVQSTSMLTEKLNIRSEYLAGRNPLYFKKNMAVLHAFFMEAQFSGVQRDVLFGFTEFLLRLQ
ncbi:pickpocket protein 28-like [Nilaparvata lugens]|uniref:pickpocket protein 28-like n=1 Tax=Nilaparvata lugens TaxID=108931 RepID=UPI00193E47B5|nr:pickpocket protein 28-like [Nilaparvata lugens]